MRSACRNRRSWFLDREIPKGGYVRILAESLPWEERLGKTRIRTTKGLTTCMEPPRGWTIASSSWIFLRKQWSDREQELITVIYEETKHTEERYRSQTWSILRALQKINQAKRLEGEVVMSAPPFFQSAGGGDLNLGEDDGHTVVVWESSSESQQEQWSKKMGKSKDWVAWCRSMEKTKSNARLKSIEKKSSQTAASKPTPKQERRRIRNEAKGGQCAGKRGGDRATSNAQ